jgi:hypothetical protein
MTLAPIGICTYSRIEHLKQTVHALQLNTLAKESELHIFSDGPRVGDEQEVGLLREYLYQIDGFKKVHLILQQENNMVKNTYEAHRSLTRQYGRSIFMEDDIITSPHFLSFMNEALQKYEFNKQVMSIGGYCPPVDMPRKYDQDVFFSKIFCPWGVGIWEDRFAMIDQERDFRSKAANNHLANELKYLGKNLNRRFRSLPKRIIQDTDTIAKFDLLATIAMVKRLLFTVMPRYSLINNIGLDGTGLRCTLADSRLSQQVDLDFFPKRLPSEVTPSEKIISEMYLLQSFSTPKSNPMKLFYLFLRRLNYELGKIKHPHVDTP